MAAKAERYTMYYYNRRYTNTNMTRLKGSQKKNKKEGRRELVRDTLDYMAQDVQYMMLEKKRLKEEALGFQRFPRGMDAEIERRRKEKNYNRKKRKTNHKPCDGKPPLPAINQTNMTGRGIFHELHYKKQSDILLWCKYILIFKRVVE